MAKKEKPIKKNIKMTKKLVNLYIEASKVCSISANDGAALENNEISRNIITKRLIPMIILPLSTDWK